MLFSWLRNRRRRKLLARPFPHWWEPILARNVGHYARLSEPEQARLRDITRILVEEKQWEGGRGLLVTEEMRVTIAAEMSLLLLAMDHNYYAQVPSVVIYPGSFRTPATEQDLEDDDLFGTTSVDPSGFRGPVLDGQAVYRGPVIVAWENALAEARDPECGFNLVIHEAAHQLDFFDNAIRGIPDLGDRELEARWRYVMTVAFEDHRRVLKRDDDTFFTEHAGDDEMEFFADATEALFCRPHDLHAEAPEVFDLLSAYYRLDPRRWFPDHAADES